MNPRSNNSDTLDQAAKSIQAIKRHRKQRYAKFRDMAREEEANNVRDMWSKNGGEEVVCPVCSQTVRGDQDVLDAHVDACLANESRRLDDERQREQEQEEIWEEGDEGHAGHVGNLRGP
jgi:DNA repair exonuclease SbcCD ATPase subunit